MNTNTRPALAQSGHLFREAYRTLCDAMFVLFRLELPRKWAAFKQYMWNEHLVQFHGDTTQKLVKQFRKDFAGMLFLFACAVAFYVAVWYIAAYLGKI